MSIDIPTPPPASHRCPLEFETVYTVEERGWAGVGARVCVEHLQVDGHRGRAAADETGRGTAGCPVNWTNKALNEFIRVSREPETEPGARHARAAPRDAPRRLGSTGSTSLPFSIIASP